MSDPERPPLDPRVYEQIESALYKIDLNSWKQLSEMQVEPQLGLLPSPPQLPIKLRGILHTYASLLFKTEADQYPTKDAHIEYWLCQLLARVTNRVMLTVERVEKAGIFKLGSSLKHHGLTRDEMRKSVSEYLQGVIPNYTSIPVDVLPSGTMQADILKVTRSHDRLPSTVDSLSAARKMEAFIKSKGIGLTEFATSAGVTDRTLRSFRKTGKIRRSLLAQIAKAMGTTKENMLGD